MGVKGLWQLLEPIGKPINLESLENKVLAVDFSIWLNQSIKGIRDKHGHPVQNAHIKGLFNRICKLLFYKIKPIFVFDGGVPVLKKQTIATRHKRRLKSLEDSEKNAHKALKTFLRSQIKRSLGSESDDSNLKLLSTYRIHSNDNVFELPALENENEFNEVDDQTESFCKQVNAQFSHLQNLNQVDINSEAFKSLPPEIRHEILTHLKEQKTGWAKISALPSESNEFSSYQMSRLLHKRKLQQNIEVAEEEMNDRMQSEELFDFSATSGIRYESKRVMSDENTRIIYCDKSQNVSKSDSKNTGRVEVLNSFKKCDSLFSDVTEFDFGKSEAIKNENSSFLKTASKTGNFSPLEATKIIKRNIESDKKQRTEFEIQNSDSYLEFSNSMNKLQQTSQICNDLEANIAHDSDFDVPDETLSTINSEETTEAVSDEKVNEDIEKELIEVLSNDSYDSLEIVKTPEPKSSVTELSEESKKKDRKGESQVIEEKFTDNGDIPSKYEAAEFKSPIKCASGKNHQFESVKETPEKRNSEVFTKIRDAAKASPQSVKRQLYEIEREVGRQERHAATVSDQMIIEAQELLRLFGIPFVRSPLEAEAQCAALENLELTEGTITDDSDIWLFGGKTVYKNFFNQSKYVEVYNLKDIEKDLKINRESMVCLAMLTGSDYTDGIEGIGAVTAVEILSEFKGEGLEPLENFKSWWDSKQGKDKSPGNKTRAKFIKFSLEESFPNKVVFNAYMNPKVDDTLESFKWGVPDLDLLRHYAMSKFGWNKSKVDEVLLPVIKRLNEKKVQMRISDYFKCEARHSGQISTSKRLQSAFDKLGSESSNKSSVPRSKSKTLAKSSLKQKVKNQATRNRGKAASKVLSPLKKVSTESKTKAKKNATLSEPSSSDGED
ncbi:DNA repair protein complementing XP-G cells-like protein [Dinothrombium tinctorium]|uniref:DNA repair protein complementing XP-G cells-like protein n=1 Tax=Dinothrombium tinctorium TaxID=1965070 RepID=A0A3S3PD51_9ACAR|nr:DNA repair protein complementing XP-G cells-like protein [Dinothrombium tinctorium]